LLRSYATPAGRRVLVSGNGPLNLQVAAELTRAGVEVVAVAELGGPWSPRRAGHLAVMAACVPSLAREGAGYLATLRRRRVPLLSRSAVVRLDGDSTVRSATVARLDDGGRPVVGSERTFEVDAVCTGFGFVPSAEVSRALGCAHRYDAAHDVVEVERDELGRTSVANVWVIGDGGASLGAKVALAQGMRAGAALAAELAPTPPAISRGGAAAKRAYRRHLRFQRALAQVYAAPQLGHLLATEDTVVCRCENRTLAEVRAESDVLSAGAIKRVTRAGMGPCQGRYCAAVLTSIARENSGVPVDERSGFRAQAPFKPVRIGVIADADG
jgi:pyruvate/2-oxoglutarate dehydrogenase complex dihydrolipoamide dehydrogenase (E3) component